MHCIDIHVRCDAHHAIVTRDGGQKAAVYEHISTYVESTLVLVALVGV